MKIEIHVREKSALSAEQIFDRIKPALAPEYDVIIVSIPTRLGGLYPNTFEAIKAAVAGARE